MLRDTAIGTRLATRNDVTPLSQALGRSFLDDPVMAWLFPEPADRLQRITAFFALMLERQHLKHGEVWTSDNLEGAAAWDSPGHWRTEFTALLGNGPALILLLGRRTVTGLQGLTRVEKRHPRQPHWYLAILGTDPPSQGRGVGSAMLAPVLQRCDAEGLGAYLESSKERNVPYYQRHGFHVTEEMTLPKGPPIWLMWRDPA